MIGLFTYFGYSIISILLCLVKLFFIFLYSYHLANKDVYIFYI